MELTCINCPVGCRIDVTVENGEIKSIAGNSCKRGEIYAKQESTAPQRMVTAVVGVAGSPMPLSVKTKSPIPKKDIAACMKEIEALELALPIQLGQVVLDNVCGSGVPVIATKSLK